MVDKSDSQTLSAHRARLARVFVSGTDIAPVANPQGPVLIVKEGICSITGPGQLSAFRFAPRVFPGGPVRGMYAGVQDHSISPQHGPGVVPDEIVPAAVNVNDENHVLAICECIPLGRIQVIAFEAK